MDSYIPEHLQQYEWYAPHQAYLGYDVSAIPHRADLYGADLRGANLRGVNLRGANLRRANLREADLRDADLYDADLRGVNLYDADLRGADLRWANLREADLRSANLHEADLRSANLHEAKWDYMTIGIHPAPQGTLHGWGKKSRHIVHLLIPEDVRRSCATTREFRCERAQVLEVFDPDGNPVDEVVHNAYDLSTVYRVGQMVEPDSWDDYRWNECSNGISFVLTREEAEAWEE